MGSEKNEDLSFLIAQEEEVRQAFSELGHKMMKQGMTTQEAAGMDPQFLEGLYAQAYRLYNTGKYLDAAHMFRSLILINSMESKYILGLAACYHMLKEYNNAIQNYTICSITDPQNPLPYYYSSDCFAKLKDHISTLLYLELTINACGNRPEFSKIKERAVLSLEGLKKGDVGGFEEAIPPTP
jgi:type III secretion system low calcium response chaperone LcrH/SycD